MKKAQGGRDNVSSIASKLQQVEVDFVNPFIAALQTALQMMTMGRATAQKGVISLINANCIDGETLIFLRIDGAIKGLVILNLQEELAKKFVSTFLLGVQIEEMDEMAKNSLAEFSLRVAEIAHSQLVKKGYLANVSFHINYNKPLQFSKDHQFILVPLTTELGPFNGFFNVMKTDVIEQLPTN